MNRKQLRAAEEAIRKTAEKEGVSVEYVRNEITIAIKSSMQSPDPTIQAQWQAIPCVGEIPTPEEFIAYSTERAKKIMQY